MAARLEADGNLQDNAVRRTPEFITGGWRDGDERFDVVTGRRAVVERSFAAAAEETSGVTVRRGVAGIGVLTGPPLPSTRGGWTRWRFSPQAAR